MYLDNLRQICKTQGLSYKELAHITGITHQHVSQLAARNHSASPQTCAKLAIALNVSPDALIKPLSVNDLLADLVGQIREYTEHSKQMYAEYGVQLKKIAE